jgi:hypothetical protein
MATTVALSSSLALSTILPAVATTMAGFDSVARVNDVARGCLLLKTKLGAEKIGIEAVKAQRVVAGR